MIPAGPQYSFWSSDGVLGNRSVLPQRYRYHQISLRRRRDLPSD